MNNFSIEIDALGPYESKRIFSKARAETLARADKLIHPSKRSFISHYVIGACKYPKIILYSVHENKRLTNGHRCSKSKFVRNLRI